MFTWIEKLIVAFIFFAVCGILFITYSIITAEAKCLAKGWPEAKVTFGLTVYCIKRVNQTDEVIKLNDLK